MTYAPAVSGTLDHSTSENRNDGERRFATGVKSISIPVPRTSHGLRGTIIAPRASGTSSRPCSGAELQRGLGNCWWNMAGPAAESEMLPRVLASVLTPFIEDFESQLGPRRFAIATRVANVAFSISAVNAAGTRQKIPGSGVFIAPYLAVTAKHVMTDILKIHDGKPEYGNPLNVGVKLHQVVTLNRSKFADIPWPTWDVKEYIECPYSDLALLDVLPANAAAEKHAAAKWNDAMFRLRLLPPAKGARVHAFGYPAAAWDFDETTRQLNVTSGVVFSEGIVSESFSDWRIDPGPDPPAILGTPRTADQSLTDFSCFEMTAPVEEGMSGGPVFYDDDLLGIVSTGFELHEDEKPNIGAQSRVASLWPLIFTKNLPTGLARVSFLELLESALINGPDWRDARSLGYLEEVHGKLRARWRSK
jgi:hypothetical protein